MTRCDLERFSRAWSSAFELCSRGKVPSAGAINLAFYALQQYELQIVLQALARHCKSDGGRYGLTLADIVQQIDGPQLTADQVIGMAMRPTCALGVLARIEIGSWNLANWKTDQLRPLAHAVLDRLPELKARIKAGQFAANEIAALQRFEITENLQLDQKA